MSSHPHGAIYGFAELSAVTGMSTSTLNTLLHRSRTNRKADKCSENDIPEPDSYLGSSPVWLRDTVERWLTRRARGASSTRAKRLVDPQESLRQGRAVPLTHSG